ncbi:hypothetical protein AVEN_15552-1 [Araneus ventricosus]|uniref:Uncharacterized protein n=1 Tax=Araneus ventricosus TaxID=182803 RepID=A0A4Y2FST2_ARAVE|nr:hypothetical protein AVEN_15552-1 [Araneus ventricosus]
MRVFRKTILILFSHRYRRYTEGDCNFRLRLASFLFVVSFKTGIGFSAKTARRIIRQSARPVLPGGGGRKLGVCCAPGLAYYANRGPGDNCVFCLPPLNEERLLSGRFLSRPYSNVVRKVRSFLSDPIAPPLTTVHAGAEAKNDFVF